MTSSVSKDHRDEIALTAVHETLYFLFLMKFDVFLLKVKSPSLE